MDSPEKHDEATLKAIKANISGLQRISGERIWSEWNKILAGRFAVELTLKLLECGAAKHIGLPEEPDLESFRAVYRRASSNDVTLRPISIIVPMLRDQREVMSLHGRLKLSNSDRDLALFLVQHREVKPCERPLRPYQRLVFTQQTSRYDVYREYVKELLRYRGATKLLDEFERWVIPKFPIGGTALMGRVSQPKMLGRVLNELRRIWLDEDFKPTGDQLMEHVPRILSEMNDKAK